ncbi:type II toxin-antitoxin system HipA family toxin [Draconibacterium sediminis]|uniref:Phosphatidylinositol kinase n=1 Tax=Draconibacterium sediminis TaxID=1544798 RepID=A0A0D8JB69_9BACT|nr:HipA domain-containing protein [Draconibacterium sediminis]KJF44167.1 phosphatidylinositol kinase [Draconibacterium sediminis]
MSLPKIKYCPGTLAEGFNTYSTTCLRKVFAGKKVNHILPYAPPRSNEEDTEKFIENRKRISISGVQEKISLLLDKNKLRLTEKGEQGTYILKPIPIDLKNTDQVPANEHLTMQIAQQVYGLQTADNAMIFFNNGEPAYITKRFDVKKDGSKWGKEDFATLAGKTEENEGPNFKYDYSYEALGELLKKYASAWRVEIEKLFSLIVFNYLFSNGDAHLKNFSLLETSAGDYVLSPAYDLLNTRIHVDDSDFALSEGLFSDAFQSEAMEKNHHPGLDDFRELAKRFEIKQIRSDKILAAYTQLQPMVEELTQRSFLNEKTKRAYLLHYQTRRNRLRS